MKMKKAVSFVLSAAAVAALAVPALAEERPANLTIAPRPENVTIAPRPENVTIAPRPDGLTIAPGPGQEPVICPPNPAVFTDVDVESAEGQAVAYVQSKSLMNGVAAGLFAPETAVTRAMALTTLWRMAGSPVVNYLLRYDDVEEGTWYAEAVRWAASEKLIDQEAASLLPGEIMTREALCRLIYAYAQHEEKGFQGQWAFLLPYEDRADMAEEAYEAVAWCVVSKVLDQGEGVLLQPKSQVTRGQLAVYLQRLCENMEW